MSRRVVESVYHQLLALGWKDETLCINEVVVCVCVRVPVCLGCSTAYVREKSMTLCGCVSADKKEEKNNAFITHHSLLTAFRPELGFTDPHSRDG